MQLNAGQLQYIRLAQPVSGTQVVQGQIQTLATNAQQVCAPEMWGLGLSWGPAGAGFWLQKNAQHTTLSHPLILQQEPPLYPAHLFCIPASQGTKWGFLMDCTQSASLTIKFSSDKEMHGREVSGILEESLMYMHACLTRGSILTNCLIVRLNFHL